MAKINIVNEKEMYRVYIAECLRTIVENTAKFGGGTVIKKHYYDLINTNTQKKKQNVDNIIANVMAKGGLKIFEAKGVTKQNEFI